jgi:tetratricopeptide (TPR) repeat protein
MFGRAIVMKYYYALFLCLVLLPTSATLPVCAQSSKPKPPELIRDTGVAEGMEASEAPQIKAQDPVLAKQSINIGNYYLKQKNYAAAIERYREAIEYQPNSSRAYEALARAYEKNGDITKAIGAYKAFIEKNPNTPDASEFGVRVAKLEKKGS